MPSDVSRFLVMSQPDGSIISNAVQVTLAGATSGKLPVLRLACTEINAALVIGFKKGFTARIATSVVQEELEVSPASQSCL